MNDIYLPPAKINAILRLARQRQRLEANIASRKKRILSIINGYIPGIRQTFSNMWSPQGRAFLRTHLNPLAVARSGEKALDRFLTRARFRRKEDAEESHMVYLTCKMAATIYEKSRSTGAIDDDFFVALQDEIARELRLMEAEEAESEAIAAIIAASGHREIACESDIPGVTPFASSDASLTVRPDSTTMMGFSRRLGSFSSSTRTMNRGIKRHVISMELTS